MEIMSDLNSRISAWHEQISNIEAKCREAKRAHDATLEAGAAANIAQKELLEKQNMTLQENYDKLKELYDVQKESAKETKKELHRSRIFNGWMMAIAVISMFAAIGSLVLTFLESR